ncbi:MAG: hypothetical protein SFX73_15795 [Kofleriaceae bacterium]|nr:hypothetical protein [Kofleriaceae bacterium]
MRMILVTMLAASAGCGGKGDDCQRFVDKSKPVLLGMGKDAGREVGEKELAQMVSICRSSDKAKADPVMKCVLDAKDESGVRACYGTAFGDYMSKAKRSEAELMLNSLSHIAKAEYVTNSEFPKGKAGPTPAKACCEQPEHKCAVVDDWAKDPVWTALGFSVDQPGMFQYTYESDGQTAKVTATGDLDCDGNFVTYTLEASAKDGEPQTTVTKPTTVD